jgi:hypothetical protein
MGAAGGLELSWMPFALMASAMNKTRTAKGEERAPRQQRHQIQNSRIGYERKRTTETAPPARCPRWDCERYRDLSATIL